MRGGLLGLISLSLVGVGFSSWLITSKDSPSRDTPLDSIGADGEFSDINNYLNIDKIDDSGLYWNNSKKKTFNGPNQEIIADNPGYLYIYFSRDTGDDLIKDHLIRTSNTFKVVLDFSKAPNASGGDPISAFSKAISDIKLIGQASSFSVTPSFDSGYSGTKKEGSWQGIFTVDQTKLSNFSTSKKYYFGVQYKFNASDISFSSSVRRTASVHVEF